MKGTLAVLIAVSLSSACDRAQSLDASGTIEFTQTDVASTAS